MLSIKRKEGESFLIYPDVNIDPNMTLGKLFEDGPIWIRMTSFDGRKIVKIDIEAPKSLRVMREELVKKPACQN